MNKLYTLEVKAELMNSQNILRRLHTVSSKVENTRFRSKILYIDILLEEWNVGEKNVGDPHFLFY